MGQIAVKWTGQDSQMFVGRDSFGHVLVMGSWPAEENLRIEWKGLKPSDLLVLSLASCSAHDVVMILKKQRQELTDLCVVAEAKQLPDPPYTFTHIHLRYVLTGRNLDPQKVERAIFLSQNNYCSVAATIRATVKLTYDLTLHEAAGVPIVSDETAPIPCK